LQLPSPLQLPVLLLSSAAICHCRCPFFAVILERSEGPLSLPLPLSLQLQLQLPSPLPLPVL
jgi:hypothetical protein